MKYNLKGTCIFNLILVGTPSSVTLSVKNRGGGGRDLLNGQNLLSVTKGICQWSLMNSFYKNQSKVISVSDAYLTLFKTMLSII